MRLLFQSSPSRFALKLVSYFGFELTEQEMNINCTIDIIKRFSNDLDETVKKKKITG